VTLRITTELFFDLAVKSKRQIFASFHAAPGELMVRMFRAMQQGDGRIAVSNNSPGGHSQRKIVGRKLGRADNDVLVAQGREQLHELKFGLFGLLWLFDFFAAFIFSLTHLSLFS